MTECFAVPRADELERRVQTRTSRRVRNLSETEEAVYVCVGGKDGYVGRDGKLAEGETHR